MKNLLFFIGLSISIISYGQTEDLTVYTKISTSSQLGSNSIYSIAVDENNLKWIGCYHSGGGALYTFDDATWGSFTKNDGLINTWVLSTAFDSNGKAWIGTDGGLSTFTGSVWTDYNPIGSVALGYNVLPAQDIWDVAFDQQNNVWLASYQGGIAKLENDTVPTVYNMSNSGLADDNVYGIVVDLSNNIWAATKNNGVSKFDGSTWTSYNSSNSDLPHNDTKDIHVDKHGNVWVACYSPSSSSGGVAKFDGTTWTVYNEQNSGLVDNTVYSVAVDTNDVLWVGTNSGLSKFDGNSWYSFTTSNSILPNNQIKAIAVDNNNVKWIGSSGGLMKVEDGSTVSIGEESFTQKSIYPNPVSDILYLNETTNYRLYNQFGALVLEGNSSTINVEHFSPGIYFLTETEARTFVKVVVK